jgi:two-component system NtrC family sensor kinase
MAEISIIDTGCGIPEADMKKIFDPFFSSKEVGKGTGLGLSVSHGIVEAHGGLIEVESRVGKGTTFRVYLPLETAAEGGNQS